MCCNQMSPTVPKSYIVESGLNEPSIAAGPVSNTLIAIAAESPSSTTANIRSLELRILSSFVFQHKIIPV